MEFNSAFKALTVRQNRHVSIRGDAELINIDKEIFDRFYMTISTLKMCSIMVLICM